MQQEIEAYKEMHGKLVTDYLGMNVAIYQGRLIDYDADVVTLAR